MFTCEAQGLAWLAQPRAITIPTVIAVSDETSQGPHFLVLEWIASAERSVNFDEQLGEQLATLHASVPNTFGLEYDNFIATLEQSNTPHESWADFYVTCRLEPQLQRAVDNARVPRAWTNSFASLFSRMEELVGAPESPARLHGDLWSGNLHTDAQGNPCLIDPAVYGGHREIDLAMLNLFGDPGPRFLSTYNECYPLASGAEERVALYQLYPLLVHVNLFGGHYVGSVEQALKQYL
jgi:fructosamine-3-kinase